MSVAAQHIPFRLIKQLSAYSALFESIPEALASHQQDEIKELNTLESSCLRAIELLAPQTSVSAPNGSTDLLPVYLNKVHTGFANNVNLALQPVGVQSQIGIKSFNELSSRLLTDYCEQCTGICGQPPCNGQDPIRDAQTVSVQGDCVAYLHSLFERIKQIAIQYYATYAVDPAMVSRVGVQFGTRFVNEKPSALGPNLPISAVTNRQKGSPHSFVFLYFYVDPQGLLVLNRSSLLGLPYILMHELICHVFDGVAIGGDRRTRDDQDAFAEGWMDWTAFQIMNKALFGIVPKRPTRIGEVSGQHTASKEAFEARNAPGQGATYKFYRFGSEVAYDFSEFLRRFRPGAEAWDLFLQISLKLTVWREDTTKMHRFLTNLRLLVPRPDDQAPSSLAIDGLKTLTPIVEEFMKTGEIIVFRESILAS
jgi:hypothetical protein